jgi:uncharacterized membrane protein (DUF373 family)
MSFQERSEDEWEEGTRLEKSLNRHTGNFIHVFLSILALMVMAAAVIAAGETIYRDFPKLLNPQNPYDALHLILQNILLLAIAGELALLLLSHRASAALEVVMFVIARRLVATDVTPVDLLVGAMALAGLLIVRFYYIPGKPK